MQRDLTAEIAESAEEQGERENGRMFHITVPAWDVR